MFLASKLLHSSRLQPPKAPQLVGPSLTISIHSRSVSSLITARPFNFPSCRFSMAIYLWFPHLFILKLPCANEFLTRQKSLPSCWSSFRYVPRIRTSSHSRRVCRGLLGNLRFWSKRTRPKAHLSNRENRSVSSFEPEGCGSSTPSSRIRKSAFLCGKSPRRGSPRCRTGVASPRTCPREASLFS